MYSNSSYSLAIVDAFVKFGDAVVADISADVMIGVLSATANGVAATGIGVTTTLSIGSTIWAATMTTWGSMPILVSVEEALSFGSEAFSCRLTADWNWRALQAWMPSYHV